MDSSDHTLPFHGDLTTSALVPILYLFYHGKKNNMLAPIGIIKQTFFLQYQEES